MLQARLVPDACGTAARLSVGNMVWMELLHLCFLPLSSSPAHPAHPPPLAASPFPAPLSGFAHTLFLAATFCFALGFI